MIAPGWLTCAEALAVELDQAFEEGRDVTGLEAEIRDVLALDAADPRREARAAAILDRTRTLPLRKDYEYEEPSDLDGIRDARPDGRFAPVPVIRKGERERLYDKVYGAWLGRSAGCLLGQPVEGWRRERLRGFLRETGNYPIRSYMSSDVADEIVRKYGIKNKGQVYGSTTINWINNVRHMVEDDDMNYTILGLRILETCGCDFTPYDAAGAWLMNLPILHVCTAERVAYKNLVNLVPPPDSAAYRNAYREWIGAQIRADAWGYANPGNPEKAAEMAWRDASISHVKNGIYGEMWTAAMLAAAAVTSEAETIIRAGLGEIPVRSRLAGGIYRVITWSREGIGWEEAIDRIHRQFNEANPHHWCHTIPNAMIVAAALLFGELDFERSIGIAVSSAFDTDCNGATVGSILGMIHGAKALPAKWTAPLNDRIRSGVDGFGLVRISGLAERTVNVMLANPFL